MGTEIPLQTIGCCLAEGQGASVYAWVLQVHF